MNKHLEEVSGHAVRNMFNRAQLQRSDVSTSDCFQQKIEKINTINTVNSDEIQECLQEENASVTALNDDYLIKKQELDAISAAIIAEIQACIDTVDNAQSVECTYKLDTSNHELSQNSGKAYGYLQNFKSESTSIEITKKTCVDDSLRKASKAIFAVQKEIRECNL